MSLTALFSPSAGAPANVGHKTKTRNMVVGIDGPRSCKQRPQADHQQRQIARVMKITALIILSACITASARTDAQIISLNVKDAPLEKVFAEIKKQAAYTFVYYKDDLAKADKVTLKISNTPIEEVLNQVFKNQPLTYTIVDKTVVVKQKTPSSLTIDKSPLTLPPPIDIHGRIVNEKNEPVAASIIVKGTNKGTSTNDNGEFELKGVDDNATLVISGVSIESFEVKVAGRSELALSAKIKTTQGDVVTIEANTGYQRVKPNEVTGAISVINNKDINQQTGTNILQRLNNITTGIYFDVARVPISGGAKRNTNISIRGLNSVLGTLDPLVVLDNFIYEGDINNINPNDIESVTILKDAAATSIYGARGGNGVIVITSKKGNFNQRVKVDVNAIEIVNQKPDYFSLPQMSVSDYINTEEYLFNKGYDFNGYLNLYPVALTPAVTIFKNRKAGLISSSDSAMQINALKAIDTRDQYNKYFNRTGIVSQYSMNVSGGSSNMAWLIGGNYDKTTTNTSSQNEKVNVRINNTYKPIKNLLVNLGVYYTNSKSTTKGSYPAFNSTTIAFRNVPYLQYADLNGNALPISPLYQAQYTDTAGAGKLLDWKYYPLENSKHDYTMFNGDEILTNIGLTYQVKPWLNVDMKYQYEKQRIYTEHVSDLQSYYARDLINKFSQVNYSTGVVTYIVPKGGILTTGNGDLASQNFRGQLNFHRMWNKHILSAIAGSEIRDVVNSSNSKIFYGYDGNLLTTKPIDNVNSYPTFVFGGTDNIPSGNNLLKSTNRFASLYANAAYTFNNKYTLFTSGRRDASNVFGLSTNDKWNPFWSAGLGWKISNESFFHLNALVPDLKLRVSYGSSGNVDNNRTALPVGTASVNPITGYTFIQINSPNDPTLKWEKVKQFNTGIDFVFSKNVVAGSFDYYLKGSTDLYGPTPYDYTTFGRNSQITKNVAALSGKGFEINIKTKNLDREFKWQTRFLVSHNTNKLTKYYSLSSQSIATLVSLTNTIQPVVGKPLYSIAAYKWGGLSSTGMPQGYANGQLTTDYSAIQNEAASKGVDGNIAYIGPSTPTYFGNFINEFYWKSISLSFNISYKLGYYFRKTAFSSTSLVTQGIGHADFAKRWQKPGDELITSVPAFMYPFDPNADNFYAASEVNVDKADHIRFQYINLAYTIDGISKKLPSSNLELYLNVANLGILWRANKDNLDPDFLYALLPTKQFTVGLRAHL